MIIKCLNVLILGLPRVINYGFIYSNQTSNEESNGKYSNGMNKIIV